MSDEEFLLSDIDSGEVVFSFPLLMIALLVRDPYVNSCSIQGVQLANPIKHWTCKQVGFQAQFEQRRAVVPEVFNAGQLTAEASQASTLVVVHEVLRSGIPEVVRSGVHEVTRSHTDNVDYCYPIELPANPLSRDPFLA